MREPSSLGDLHSWWRRTVLGEVLPMHEGDPQCGWYKVRLVKRGPWVPARIRCVQDIDPFTGELCSDEFMVCDVDGGTRDARHIWTYLTPITRAEYDGLVRQRETSPVMAATLVAVDLVSNPTRPTR